MNFRKFHALAFCFMFFIALVSPISIHTPSIAQFQENKDERKSWKDTLYEKDVQYENFVCNEEDSEIVSTFFKEHPLYSGLPICHNDCPIIKCRPLIPFPQIAKAAKVTGTVSVHILVDEKGKVLYARILGGHPLLWAAAKKGACETQFKEFAYGKHQGVMHFTVDDYEYLGVPKGANQVR
ncbi:MAG TPA: energy transducer TonB [Pyrinomonadaceae bacterium]|jgi:hypothetical protein